MKFMVKPSIIMTSTYFPFVFFQTEPYDLLQHPYSQSDPGES